MINNYKPNRDIVKGFHCVFLGGGGNIHYYNITRSVYIIYETNDYNKWAFSMSKGLTHKIWAFEMREGFGEP